jgi:hypothetical protein
MTFLNIQLELFVRKIVLGDYKQLMEISCKEYHE